MATSAEMHERNANEDPSTVNSSVRKRYQDGYRVSNTIVGVGNAIKVIGIIIALMFVVAGISILGVRAGSIVGILIIAVLVATVFFTLGVLVSAQGQILRAGLDVAVYSSTFLKDKDRAAIMGLHKMAGQFETTGSESESPDSNSGTNSQFTGFCYHCGAEISEPSSKCPSCKKAL
jgi:hypothetical protein